AVCAGISGLPRAPELRLDAASGRADGMRACAGRRRKLKHANRQCHSCRGPFLKGREFLKRSLLPRLAESPLHRGTQPGKRHRDCACY
ncbi:MAG TPA: hypothetical protein VNH11_20805, partial [Pirellulales bacterium]|nr:hypothetical protein [Pirellulales bacterium]